MKKLLILFLCLCLGIPSMSYGHTKVPKEQPKIRIWKHEGGKKLDVKLMQETIKAISRHMGYEQDVHFQDLIIETIAVETELGLEDVQMAARRYKNYGILQFRIDSAKDIIANVKKQRNHHYQKLMALYDHKLSLKDNLMYNVPFSIALCMEYYKQRKKSSSKITTKQQRAQVWKKYYNTEAGSGTVSVYIKKVNLHIYS